MLISKLQALRYFRFRKKMKNLKKHKNTKERRSGLIKFHLKKTEKIRKIPKMTKRENVSYELICASPCSDFAKS